MYRIDQNARAILRAAVTPTAAGPSILDDSGEWHGTATELRAAVVALCAEAGRAELADYLPTAPALSRALLDPDQRILPSATVTASRTMRARTIHIRRTEAL
ncbi:hypothetical protein [Micromonospora ureilytica]|uniref:Uncharacterized protein n=1 Tax=Micromonospora ureilytica TaxID=709868 RepID=A0ABS0JLD4_9ACTN|nr:hypothetical protein [Micromonospora ureilytica]MBG6067864.1 hypothetical protein [Micromonospora ureilytica]